MNEPVSISVIIPVYNCDRYLAEAIDSVLAQTYPASEIIVIDDGSIDDSPAVAQSYGARVRYQYQPQQGAGAARNHGVELATGDLLAFLDADDLWTPDKLALQVKALTLEPSLEAVFGQVQQFHCPHLSQEAKDQIYCPSQMMAGYSPSAMLIRRASFLRVGWFETHLQIGEFVSWYTRASELGIQTQLLPDLIAFRRLHQTNISRQRRQARTDFARLLKASIDRRKLSAREQA